MIEDHRPHHPKRKSASSPVERAAAIALFAAAFLYGLPSVFYPLGSDEARRFYITREWQLHNLIPYKNTFSEEPPGIHFVYLLAVRLFGAHPFAIRFLELLAVLGIGVFAAMSAARRKVKLLELLSIVLLTSAYYFTCTDFEDTAQPEIWVAFCLLAAQATISVDKNKRKAAIVSGLWMGFAVLLRPAALLFLPVLIWQLVANGIAERPEPEKWPSVSEMIVAFFVGLLQPPAFFAGYFATRDAWQQYRECVFGAGWWAHPGALHEISIAAGSFFTHAWLPIASGCILYIGAIVFRSRPAAKLIPPSLTFIVPWIFATALACIYFSGATRSRDWVFLLPLFALAAADGLLALGQWRKEAPPIAATILVVALFATATPWPANPATNYAAQTRNFWRYAFGSLSRNDYFDSFRDAKSATSPLDSLLAGEAIALLAEPGDALSVPGDHAAVYASSDLTAPGRFFAAPQAKVFLPAYRAEQHLLLTFVRPRFFLVEKGGPEEQSCLANGYRRQTQSSRFELFVRE